MALTCFEGTWKGKGLGGLHLLPLGQFTKERGSYCLQYGSMYATVTVWSAAVVPARFSLPTWG